MSKLSSVCVMLGCLLSGCTSPALKTALQAQGRAEEILTSVLSNQAADLKLALFSLTLERLDRATTLGEKEAALRDAFKRRDQLEFYAVQVERAWSMFEVTVQYLYSRQSFVDLLLKRGLEDAKQVLDG